ncbi:uncharacterized protein L199_006895 [Kwoniella botswanensis]|uniref:uncharacterized protein n=1 Tax=Kwoniella botswanensis TaxID=1268659 RepID=UPI00315C7B16
MCAISFRFLDSADNSHSDGGSQAFTLAKEIVADIMVDIQEFSEARLATILLMAQHEHESGRYGSSWMLIPMAVRMAFTLRLNLELDDSYPWKYRETRRRLMWATFCLDKMTFGGISEFSSIETRRMKIDLPSPNHNFENDIPVPGRTLGEVQSAADTSTNSQIDQDGLVSRYIRLTDIRSDVLSYTKNLSENASLAWEQDSPFQLCFQRLQQWQDSLPPLLIFSLSNLQHGQEDVIALFYLHIFYHQIHCDLYRMTLPGFRESAPPEYLARAPVGWVNRTRDACYLHAVEIIKKISFMAEHFDHFIPNDSVLIIFVYECIRNQIQYIKITYPGGPSREDHQQVSTGFEMIMDVAGRTVKYFGRIWRAVSPNTKL